MAKDDVDRNIWIYDLETYPNMFLAMFYNIHTKKWKTYEISDRKNETKELREFLYSNKLRLIGFNNINFDYPVLHKTILSNNKQWDALSIFVQVQEIIASKYSSIWDNQTKVPQLDLFRIWHYDNKNKSTSLKWLEFAIRWENVQDLPYSPLNKLTLSQMDEIVEYCKNDVLATYEFYLKSLKHIELRQFYTNQEQMNLMSASEIKMSKEIFGKYLAKEMKMSVKDLKNMRTERSSVNIEDVIFPYLEFNDPINQRTLQTYKDYKWIDTSDMTKEQAKKHAIKFTVPYKNVVREYAEGGLHSFGKAGIYESDDDYVLMDVDFASFYPHISFRNGLHPEHIPAKLFNELYEGFYHERKKYPKSDPRNYVLKIILNGSYGLSKDKHAFLYDPKWQLEICINGQLILTLLTEKVMDVIPDAQIIFENTDGAMYRIPRKKVDELTKACQEVEKIVNIPLEIQECKKIVARDVNNYINIISDDNIKFKGAFEIDRDFHKNHSKRVVPIALANYFIHGSDVVSTIKNHLKGSTYTFAENHGIYDFCLGAKMKNGNKLYQRYIDGFEIIDEEIGKMNRYYVSNDGVELIKKLPPTEKNMMSDTDKHKIKVDMNQLNIFDILEEDVQVEPKDREGNLEAGYKCTIFNKYITGDYDINYDYYINECNKIISKF
jgi:hypothetical protein